MMKVMFFDTETGGLDSTKHSVFSVGALVGDLDTGEIIDKFEALHKLPSISDYSYTAKAVEIHGITPATAFSEGLTSEEIADKFVDLWTNNGAAILGGHNYNPFDVNFMARGIFKCTPEQFTANFTYRGIDTLPVIRLFSNDAVQSGATLTQAIKLFNIDLSEYGKNKFHSSLFDSIAAFKIAHKFRKILTQQDVIERLTT